MITGKQIYDPNQRLPLKYMRSNSDRQVQSIDDDVVQAFDRCLVGFS